MIQRLGSKLVKHSETNLGDMLDTRIPFLYESSPKSNMGDIKGRTQNTIKVATWNVWGAGSGSKYGGIDSNIRIRDLQERLLNAKLDFCGMQECYFNTQSPVSKLVIYPFNTAFHGVVEPFSDGKIALDFDYGNVALSGGNVVSNTNKVFTTGKPQPGHTDKEERGYTRTVSEVNGVRFCVYNTHLSYEPTRYPAQMQELCDAILGDQEQRIILMGDFNHDNLALFKPLTDAGFIIGNNKEFNTNNTEAGGTWYIDNIVYKGFRAIERNIQECSKKLADHKMFYVTLEAV
ncbi:hypothetical protein CrRp3_cds10 [Citrobacter phage vB_CroP_CrRp3]|uniref:Endonuclease/exonuclease/phosphatase domain-containing protein n=1 Tax=Citrobacter phage vB_CroP_CrRp3 TaxID=2079275 RepID=A0A2K9VAX6_9CAUD|nr:hypothetical protein HOS73_gp10 [Citrobacter phage vB_CroP_CrRp3]AUV59368.1 hypothetical protein CrRp3_cds10 [Citrobacter phage vB_CroP_CrRp3]